MPLFRATTTFSGNVAGSQGQIVEVTDKADIKDLTRAGYIEELSKDEAEAEQARRDAQAKREAEAEEKRAKVAEEEDLSARQPGPSAAETQAALNAELKNTKASKSAKKPTGSEEEAKAAYAGAEDNLKDAAHNPKPTVNAAKSGQTSQGGVDVTPAKDPQSTKGTTQATDDPAATVPKEVAEANQQAVKDQAKADAAAKKAREENDKK